MNKKIIILVIGVVIIGTLMLYLSKPGHKSIAIVMTLSHPALKRVHDHFVKTMAKTQPGLAITNYNAEGNLQQANLIAQKIASDKNIVGILAIGTLATQTIAKAEKKRPIIYAAVSDPSVLGEHTGNLCGLSDAISPSFQIETIVNLVPTIKRIALVYSPSEANSTSMVKGLAEVLDARSMPKVMIGIHDHQQIMAASASACKNSDAIIIPLDNQLVASMPTIIKATRALLCLVITSNESPIHQGATLAFGIDYAKSGEEAGRLMTTILANETTPTRIGVINPKTLDLFVNDEVIKEKNVTLDEQSNTNLVHVTGAIHG
jgi:putative tryptophan/tyrosine transport system substrate-binding protein